MNYRHLKSTFLSAGALTLAGATIVVVFFLFALIPAVFTSVNPVQANAATSLKPPDWIHIMGTDYLGRDVFSRVVYATRTSLTVGFSSVLLSMFLGMLSGLLSGYFGGYFDRVVTLVMDGIYAFPGLILAIAIAAMLGTGLPNLIVAIAIAYIPTYYRLVRSEVLAVKAEVYVEAARALGASDSEIMLDYILPNVTSSVAVFAPFNLTDVIIIAATLGFLGLGIPPPTPEWGTDMSIGRQFVLGGYWWLITFPGLMIALAAVGFNLLGEGLNEILNPRLGPG